MKQIFFLLTAVMLMFACNENRTENLNAGPDKIDSTSEEFKEERNKKNVRASIEAMNDHNLDEMMKYISPAVVDYGDGTEKPIQNRDTIKNYIQGFLKSFPDYKGEDLLFVADGDHVVVIGEWTGTFKNDLGKMKATGKKFKIRDADIFKLNDDGMIVEHRFIQPNATLFKQVSK